MSDSTIIPARSRKQAMDWALVLASQAIPASLLRSEEGRWELHVEPQDWDRAFDAIRLFETENPRRFWEGEAAWSGLAFHWGVLGWCCAMVLTYGLSVGPIGSLLTGGEVDSAAVRSGEWWRLFTAVLLHADLAHLLMNLVSGFLLLGLAMAVFGGGSTLLAGYLAGALGNVCSLLVAREQYLGLGASGMVMGALGLLSANALSDWRAFGTRAKRAWRPLFAGTLLFVLLAFDPASDVVAHSGGFVAGLGLGTVLALAPSRSISERINRASWLGLIVLNGLTLWLALAHGGRL